MKPIDIHQGERHYHVGGTEMNLGTYTTREEAEAAVAVQAGRWLARYGADAVRREPGYTALWIRGVQIDFRTAFSCTNAACAPVSLPVRRAA